MSTSTLILSVSETMAMLMKSTGHYVYHRLGTQEGKDSYKLSMRECIKHVSSGLESVDLIRSKIEGHRSEAQHLYPAKFFNKRIEEHRCHYLAIDQALDIVNSLHGRFITGQYDLEPRGFRGKGILYYEDKSIFG